MENIAEGCLPGEEEVFSDFFEIDKASMLTGEEVIINLKQVFLSNFCDNSIKTCSCYGLMLNPVEPTSYWMVRLPWQTQGTIAAGS